MRTISLIGAVHHDRIDFGDSINRNAIALLKCQWMVCGLKLDEWPNFVVAKMDPCLQIHRFRVGLEPSVQPAKKRAYM